MREMEVQKSVGWGIFLIDGRQYVWDEDDDGCYVLKGEGGEVLTILGDVRDENENVICFFVSETC